MDALNTDQKTLNGGTLTAYRKFRKNWLDGAIIGLKSEGPSKSSNWPSDVECDNGVIQAIDTVLVPGAFDKPAVFAVWPVSGGGNGFGGIGRLVVAPKASTQLQASITADVLKYHVIEGKKTMDALNTDQKTLNGGTLTAYRKFRKKTMDALNTDQ